MTPDDAAKKWIDANPDKVDAWLGWHRRQLTGSRPTPVCAAPCRGLTGAAVGSHADACSHIAHCNCVIRNKAVDGGVDVALGPRHRPRRRHRRRHRRQQPRPPPGPARLARHRPDRQGTAAQPGRLDRARVELHLPGRPLPGDHRPDARLGAAVQGDGRLHRSPAASRSPAPRSGWRSCGAGCPRPGPGASRPSWSPRSSSRRRCRSSTPTSSSAPSGRRRRRRRLAAGRHDHARAGAGDRRAHRRTRPSR